MLTWWWFKIVWADRGCKVKSGLAVKKLEPANLEKKFDEFDVKKQTKNSMNFIHHIHPSTSVFNTCLSLIYLSHVVFWLGWAYRQLHSLHCSSTYISSWICIIYGAYQKPQGGTYEQSRLQSAHEGAELLPSPSRTRHTVLFSHWLKSVSTEPLLYHMVNWMWKSVWTDLSTMLCAHRLCPLFNTVISAMIMLLK